MRRFGQTHDVSVHRIELRAPSDKVSTARMSIQITLSSRAPHAHPTLPQTSPRKGSPRGKTTDASGPTIDAHILARNRDARLLEAASNDSA